MHQKDYTNVIDLRYGQDACCGLGKEIGKFCVMTMEIPWRITKNKLGGNPEIVVFVETMEEKWLNSICEQMPEFDTIVGIGGGMAIDAAKYISWKKGKRLVSIPSILSVDAFTTPAAGIRRNHEVDYVGVASPDPLVIDFGIIRTAPPELNIAGIGDLLSMHTASFDWAHANLKGKSEFPYSSSSIEKANKILQMLYGLLGDVRENTDKGLMAIVQGYIDLNTICLPIGHFRVEEGSEHYLFYELEERLKRPFVHGYIIGLGIYIMSQLQGNNFPFIKEVMDEVKLPYHPSILEIKKDDLLKSLLNVREYVKSRPKLWYTIINDTEITEEWAEAALQGLHFA